MKERDEVMPDDLKPDTSITDPYANRSLARSPKTKTTPKGTEERPNVEQLEVAIKGNIENIEAKMRET